MGVFEESKLDREVDHGTRGKCAHMLPVDTMTIEELAEAHMGSKQEYGNGDFYQWETENVQIIGDKPKNTTLLPTAGKGYFDSIFHIFILEYMKNFYLILVF